MTTRREAIKALAALAAVGPALAAAAPAIPETVGWIEGLPPGCLSPGDWFTIEGVYDVDGSLKRFKAVAPEWT